MAHCDWLWPPLPHISRLSLVLIFYVFGLETRTKIFLKATSCKAALETCPHRWEDHGINHFIQVFQDSAVLRALEWPHLTIYYEHTITIFLINFVNTFIEYYVLHELLLMYMYKY